MTGLQLSTLALAYGADLLVGDPRWFPHPVRAMGWAISRGEWLLRRLVPWERLAGVLLVAVVVGTSYAAAWWVLRLTSGSWLGLALAVVLLFSCLSTRDLAKESLEVFRALEANDLPLARRRVGRIVGRDTDRLDEPEVVRATVETIAESTMDGIMSPLWYFVLGGVPLAIAYKAVNTLDSMIGHRSARYIRFGWAAAHVDTWANWLPARSCAVVFTLAAWCGGGRGLAAWRCAWRDGSGGPVPNAGIPEAALAGALGVRVGGVNYYQGQPVHMPAMGDPERPLEPRRIIEAVRLMYAASLTGWVMAMGLMLCRLFLAF